MKETRSCKVKSNEIVIAIANLFGLFLNVDDLIIPIKKMGSHELVDFGEDLVSDDWGANKW